LPTCCDIYQDIFAIPIIGLTQRERKKEIEKNEKAIRNVSELRNGAIGNGEMGSASSTVPNAVQKKMRSTKCDFDHTVTTMEDNVSGLLGWNAITNVAKKKKKRVKKKILRSAKICIPFVPSQREHMIHN
jgi:hypothetical protein